MSEEDGYFGEDVAARYDDPSSGEFQAETIDPVVDLLVELAHGGRALELGIGTGRIALPLAARGVPVQGIELSRAMADRLRRSRVPGRSRSPSATSRPPASRAPLAGLPGLQHDQQPTTQAAQVACFRSVAAQLEPGGCFLIEVGVPDLRRPPPGEIYVAFDVSEGHWGIDEYDVARQGLIFHHLSLVDGELVPIRPVPLRLAVRARPDGRARRDASARALERLQARAVHQREPQARVGLGKGLAGPGKA